MEHETGEKFIMRSSGVFLTGFYLGVEMKEDKRDRVCVSYGGEDIHTGFW